MKRLDSDNKDIDNVYWFKSLLALLAIIILILIYVLVSAPTSNRLIALLIDIIPSAIVVLIAIPSIYFLFYRRGLTDSQLSASIDANKIAQSIVDQLSMREIRNMSSPVINFYETYRQLDWKQLLSDSHSNIDIVVYYYDSWVNANYESLVEYFKKPRTTMRCFVADPNNDFVLDTVTRLFPEYSRGIIKEKVERTGRRIAEAVKEAGAAPERFEFYYVPHILNYSAQCIDNRILVLSVFEMYRKQKIDSSVVVLDLTKSSHISGYWDKEFRGLIEESAHITF